MVKKNNEKIIILTMAAVGLLVVLVGAADVASRISRSFFGENAMFAAFAPAVVLFNASTTDSLFGATHSTTTPIVPAFLTIPSIGVRANVEQVGKKSDGSMDTPKKFDDVAWYSPGSKPGEAGNAVIDGHVNNALTTAGVFEHLNSLNLGDAIDVADSSGHTLNYIVTSIQEYPADAAPAASVFATTGPSQLVLITCDGDWVQSDHSFDKRLVIFARLQ
jgi:LPXTG-site transpeptidase (sortase) family protein